MRSFTRGAALVGVLIASGTIAKAFPTSLFEEEVVHFVSSTRLALNATPLGNRQHVRLYDEDMSLLRNWNGYVGLLELVVQDPVGSERRLRDVLCIELEQDASRRPNNYGKFHAWGRVGWLITRMQYIDNANEMAGLQIALWEVTYDVIIMGGTADLSSGHFRHLGGENYSLVQSYAQQYIQASEGRKRAYWYHASPTTLGLNGDDGLQDYGSIIPGPMAALPFLVAAGSMLRRRKKRA
jgi:hypothetical protein